MRTLFASALLFGLALSAAAQPAIGIKFGVNAANVSLSEDLEEFDPDTEGIDKQARLGFVAGLTADLPITPQLAFRPEVLYTQKGYAYNFSTEADGESFDGGITLELDYLEVPLLLAYRIPAADGLEFSVEAGPTLAYLLDTGIGCSGDFDNELLCDDEDTEVDDDGLNDFDLGGAVGLTVGAGPFHVGLRYTNSILSIADEEATDTDGDANARNQVFTAVGIFKFGR